jgi:hypothetical protein
LLLIHSLLVDPDLDVDHVPLRDPAIRRDVRKACSAMHPWSTFRAATAIRDFPRQVVIACGDDDRLFEHQLAQRLAEEPKRYRWSDTVDHHSRSTQTPRIQIAIMVQVRSRSSSSHVGTHRRICRCDVLAYRGRLG